MLTVPRAIILAALILAVAGAASAYLINPRYTVINQGGGMIARVSLRSGDMIACKATKCALMVEGDNIILKDDWAQFPDSK